MTSLKDAIYKIGVMSMTAQSDPHASAAVYRQALVDICNFALKAQDTALRACADALAPAPEKDLEHEDDQPRGGTPEIRQGFQSSAATNGAVTTPAPNAVEFVRLEIKKAFEEGWLACEHMGGTLSVEECWQDANVNNRKEAAMTGHAPFTRASYRPSTDEITIQAGDGSVVFPTLSREQALRVAGDILELLRADALAPPEPKALTRDDCIALENLCAAKVREVREYAPDDAVEFSRLMKKVIAMRTPAPPRADALEAPPTDTPERS